MAADVAQDGDHSCPRNGFSLVEAVVCTLLVGTVLVAVLNTVGVSKTSRYQGFEGQRGNMLAQDLMAEIFNHAYEEPDDTPAFGRESGESGSQRDQWDDVDDYDGWSASPPEQADGTPVANGTGWTRNVEVRWVQVNDLSQVVGSDTGAKRITVTVLRGDRVITTVVAVRTSGI